MTKHIKRLSKALGACTLSAAVLAGCEVTNPGPVQDEFLALPASQQGLVNGAVRELSELNAFGSYTAKLFGREIFPGGQTGSHGFNVSEHGGWAEQGGHNTEWNNFSRARFIAETAATRFAEVSAPANMLYQAHLWAGVAYRTAAMYFCDSVTDLDGDPETPNQFSVGNGAYLAEALSALNQAASFASGSSEMDAVRIMRAQVYMHMDDWTNAASEAAAVSMGSEIVQEHSVLEDGLHNYTVNANNRLPWGSWSVNFTSYYDYYLETGDPRAEWFPALPTDEDNQFATASLSGFGPVPWSNSAKYGRYPTFSSNPSGLGVIGSSLVSEDDLPEVYGDYGEMQLILAENDMVNGNYDAGITKINGVRTAYQSHLDLDGDGTSFPDTDAGDNLAAYPMGLSAGVAWALLIRERNTELWMEGRRMADELRWIEQGVAAAATNINAGGAGAGPYAIGPDGELGLMDIPQWEDANHPGHTPIFLEQNRSRCWDITTNERERNPNVPEADSPGDRYNTSQTTWPFNP